MTKPGTPDKPVLLLAPIRGVTNAVFREGFAKWFGGFDGALAPYVVPEGGRLPTGPRMRDAMPQSNPSLPTIPQVLTADPEAFLLTARAYLEAGCTEINWNLGCPYPMVTRRKRGAGMLPHPDRIDAFLDRVCAELGARVSVKLRLGLQDANEIDRVLEVLNRYPLSEVTLHPRLGEQMYKGTVDVDAFARCLDISRHPLTYNGDIVDVVSFQQKRAALPTVGRWMIGRGAIANPFLPVAIRDGLSEPVVELSKLAGFHDALLEHYRATLSGPAHVLHKMKELWGYWAQSFDPKSKAIKKIVRAKQLKGAEAHAREVFDGAAKWVG
jgi:tRNA-dihydrouridine synthase B